MLLSLISYFLFCIAAFQIAKFEVETSMPSAFLESYLPELKLSPNIFAYTQE